MAVIHEEDVPGFQFVEQDEIDLFERLADDAVADAITLRSRLWVDRRNSRSKLFIRDRGARRLARGTGPYFNVSRRIAGGEKAIERHCVHAGNPIVEPMRLMGRRVWRRCGNPYQVVFVEQERAEPLFVTCTMSRE